MGEKIVIIVQCVSKRVFYGFVCDEHMFNIGLFAQTRIGCCVQVQALRMRFLRTSLRTSNGPTPLVMLTTRSKVFR